MGLLAQHPHRPSTLARELGVAAQTITYHLRILEQAGLVREMRVSVDGRSRLYAIQIGAHARIAAWLAGTGVGHDRGPPGASRRGW